ncbi:unnamed protein product [Parnassius apollo]|uniref:(apollo) hypothetical protein n=1 Tax=Parnassius apollo TaxID=110799 RepID=A0A8S3W9Z8_PARAO|nr:unnamed protein product [Parnassius apollo]
MNEKALNDLEIACALEEIFGLPDDPDVSDDNLESDEEDVQYSTVKLQRILESLDEPHDGILAPTPDPPDSLISNISNASVENQPSPSPQPTNSDRLRRARIIQNAPSTSGTQQTLRRQPQSPVANTNSDSETDDSDGEEETWKKNYVDN